MERADEAQEHAHAILDIQAVCATKVGLKRVGQPNFFQQSVLLDALTANAPMPPAHAPATLDGAVHFVPQVVLIDF
jgi:hypothetical protein